MPHLPDAVRQFSVHARHLDQHHSRLLEEASFEAAAVAYVEDLHPMTTAAHEITVTVRDVGTGHEHSFRVVLDVGEAEQLG